MLLNSLTARLAILLALFTTVYTYFFNQKFLFLILANYGILAVNT